jgi:hypothetical protein
MGPMLKFHLKCIFTRSTKLENRVSRNEIKIPLYTCRHCVVLKLSIFLNMDHSTIITFLIWCLIAPTIWNFKIHKKNLNLVKIANRKTISCPCHLCL